MNKERKYHISGMTCASCAQTVQKGVSRLPGVSHAALSYHSETLQIEGDFDPTEVEARVRALGYGIEAASETSPFTIRNSQFIIEDSEYPASRPNSPAKAKSPTAAGLLAYLRRQKDSRLALIGLLLVLPGLIFNELLPFLGLEHPLMDVLSIAAMLVAGGPIIRNAYRSLRFSREINISVLMSIAALGALAIGAYTEGGLVMVLFALGESLEAYSGQRARDAIRSLLDLAPAEARRLIPGDNGSNAERLVPVESLAVGDRIVVRPGERIPMDGMIEAGGGTVNQAPVTGESTPVIKEIGHELYAGSINGEAALTVQVTRLAEDNTIQRMIRMVEEARERKAPAERFVDQFARVYTPAIVVLAILVAAVPPLLFDQPFLNPAAGGQGWLYRALTLLVIACPCALVISTPVTIISAISNAASQGILIKGGVHLETLARLKAFAFDKTGTLTQGKPAVVAVRSVDCLHPENGLCQPCEDLLALAGAIEGRSEHPLAQAVAHASVEQGLTGRYRQADDVVALAGRGVSGTVGGQAITIGSHPYFEDTLAHETHCLAMKEAEAQGQTPVLLRRDGEYRGYIALSDTVRDSSRQALARLREQGVGPLVMLTGDNQAVAEQVGQDVGVDAVEANLLPEDKMAAIDRLRRQYGAVGMVGDGINDAPALAAADVGVAMGVAGSAQAMETADIALLKDDLGRLPDAIHLARRAMRAVRLNIGVAIGIKVLFLALVLVGLGSMWLAVLADVGASLLVTANGMRLLRG